jgi:Flp pilus assembly protein TadD
MLPLPKLTLSGCRKGNTACLGLTRVICSTAIAIALLGVAIGATAQTTVIPPVQQNNEFQQATLLYRGGQYDRALVSIDTWLKTRPKDARGRFLRGMIFAQQKKLDDAARVYLDLTQEFPELPEPYNNLAVIYAEQGDLDRARSLLESAVRANATFVPAHENLGDIHARLAAASYENALKLDASNKTAAAKLKAVNDMIPVRTPASK